MKIYRKQDGFTLVELMVGIVIMGILLASLFGLLDQSLKSWSANSHITEVQQTARFAVDAIVKDTQYATKITVTNSKDITLTELDGSTCRYFLDETNKKEKILRCETSAGKQPVTGKNDFMKVTVEDLNFSALPNQSANPVCTLEIDITVEDSQNTHYSYKLTTAVTATNVK